MQSYDWTVLTNTVVDLSRAEPAVSVVHAGAIWRRLSHIIHNCESRDTRQLRSWWSPGHHQIFISFIIKDCWGAVDDKSVWLKLWVEDVFAELCSRLGSWLLDAVVADLEHWSSVRSWSCQDTRAPLHYETWCRHTRIRSYINNPWIEQGIMLRWRLEICNKMVRKHLRNIQNHWMNILF